MTRRYGLVERGAMKMRIGHEGPNVVTMSGTMTEPDVAQWLLPLLDELHDVALVERFHEVVLDLRELEYANAALWKCLVAWLRKIREPRDRAYGLRLITSEKHLWQQIGASTLRVFGADRLFVDAR